MSFFAIFNALRGPLGKWSLEALLPGDALLEQRLYSFAGKRLGEVVDLDYLAPYLLHEGVELHYDCKSPRGVNRPEYMVAAEDLAEEQKLNVNLEVDSD